LFKVARFGLFVTEKTEFMVFCRVVWWLDTGVSEDYVASIFIGPPKRWCLATTLHGAATQKTRNFI